MAMNSEFDCTERWSHENGSVATVSSGLRLLELAVLTAYLAGEALRALLLKVSSLSEKAESRLRRPAVSTYTFTAPTSMPKRRRFSPPSTWQRSVVIPRLQTTSQENAVPL